MSAGPARRAAAPALLAAVETGTAADRRARVEAFVRTEVARVLGLSAPGAIDETQGLFDMGLDSLMAIDLKTRLEIGVGQSLPSTLTFNYPTVTALTGFLSRDVLRIVDEPAPAPAPVEEAPASTLDDGLSEDELEALLRQRLGEL